MHKNIVAPRPLLPPPSSGDSSSSTLKPGKDNDKQKEKGIDSNKKEKKKPKISLDIAALLVYTVGVKCRGLNKKEHYAPEHVFSLSEGTANKIVKESAGDLVKHCRTHLVRLYPSGTRMNSSNYEPLKYWMSGVQLVAMNWQTAGEC